MQRFGWTLLGAGLLVLSSVNMAFATAELELVSGSTTLYLYDNGTVTCAGCATFSSTDTNPATGVISINATGLNGWNVTISTGSSNSPNCSGVNGPGCLDNTTITTSTSGAGTLTAYFADTGFNTEPGFTVSESAASITGATGTSAMTQGFTTTSIPTPANLSSLSGTQIGSNLTLSSGGFVSTGGGGAAGPFDLALVTTFTAASGGASFNVDSNIGAVPEPVSLLLEGTLFVLVGVGLRFRRRNEA
jgi:hypothetical protein